MAGELWWTLSGEGPSKAGNHVALVRGCLITFIFMTLCDLSVMLCKENSIIVLEWCHL